MIEKYLPEWAQEKIAEMIEKRIEAKGLRDDEFDCRGTETNILGEIFIVSVGGRARFDDSGEIESVYFDTVPVGRSYSFDDTYTESML